ncbi:formate/nitrite transporter FocA (FNT family) [Aliiruegeria haliotis]|uniref:Formate/nitrite transporter FocA (FNT family) n=1 Tax=Aliiruegeria haliotis TaxID=1280846 RepID=A0A2T0RLS9_9RHOB|nr:formate/nitrite transporter family protein [Aliiruegeria haliotis]PRY22149.1 formate/nitrite transporter FocA (FNT family) [Aliiruegeria haliotis]
MTDTKITPTGPVEEEKLEQAEPLAPPLIYEAVRREGLAELKRPFQALFFSGIAAGILISASVLGEAIFRTYLPEAPWRPLVENLGYSLGFLLVILGRMQLFTENTITTVMPFIAGPSVKKAAMVARLWSVVLGANVIGAFMAAAMFHTEAVPSNLSPAIRALSEHAIGIGAWDSFLRGIPAGLLIATLVWILAQGRTSEFLVILAITWLIAAGDFTHIVAGSVEAAYLLIDGAASLPEVLTGFFVPVFLGNVVGGTAVFTMLAWGQVKEEIATDSAARHRVARAE